MEQFVKGQKILVTGAGRGIGKALVRSLFRGGAIVYAVTKTQEKLDELIAECPTVVPICLDISNWEETNRILGGLDVEFDGLVNNAGIAIPESIMNATKETFDSTFNVNVRGLVQVSQIIAKKMISAGKKGSIVNVSSFGSKRAGHLVGLYAASKAAVDRLTKLFAVELGPNGIRVNSVNPSLVLTDMGNSLFGTPEAQKAVIGTTPLGKMVECEDVVNAILFLLSAKSGMISGEAILIDGGRGAL